MVRIVLEANSLKASVSKCERKGSEGEERLTIELFCRSARQLRSRHWRMCVSKQGWVDWWCEGYLAVAYSRGILALVH